MENLKCPNCKSKDVRKRGFRYNKQGKKQKYCCFNCEHWFIEDNGFKRMRHNPKIITKAIHMHNDGLSLFQTKNHLWQYDGVKVTRKTINDWTKKYSLFLKSDTSSRKTRIKRKTTS